MRHWKQHKCSRRSACHKCGTSVCVCAIVRVGLPLHADKEEPHNSCPFGNDQSIGRIETHTLRKFTRKCTGN